MPTKLNIQKNDMHLTMTMLISQDLDALFQKLDRAKHIYALASDYTYKNEAHELKRKFLTVDKMVI